MLQINIIRMFLLLLINNNFMFKNNILVLTIKPNYFNYNGYYKTTTTTIPKEYILKSTPGYLLIPNINNKNNNINNINNKSNNNINKNNGINKIGDHYGINYYYYNDPISTSENHYGYINNHDDDMKKNLYQLYKNNEYEYYDIDEYEQTNQSETINSGADNIFESDQKFQTVPEYSSLPVFKLNSFKYKNYKTAYEELNPDKVKNIMYSNPNMHLQASVYTTTTNEQTTENAENVRQDLFNKQKLYKHKHKKLKEIVKPVTEYSPDYNDTQYPEHNINASSSLELNIDDDDYVAQDLSLKDVEFFRNYYSGNAENLRTSAVFPGTIWCGAGNKAITDNTFGFFFKTDICCRDHDRCFDTIPSRTKKYGLYNNGIFTKSHCDCDLDFYVCLKNVNTFVSHKVGFAYFNILRPQCFRKEYPVIKCAEWYNKRCQLYMLDETRNEKYQWFDNRYF